MDIYYYRSAKHFHFSDSDPYESENVIAYDRVLYQALSAVLRESCRSSDQVKSMLKHTLEQEPILSQWFPKSSFEQLPLLWIAVLGRYQKSAELLVSCGADVLELSGGLPTTCEPLELNDKSTVLHALVQMYPSWWNESFISLIAKEHVASLQARDDRGRTALHYAVTSRRSFQLIEIFLEKGADVNVADSQGVTALLAAIKTNQLAEELLPLLLRFGANITVKDEGGCNVLHYIAEAANLNAKRAADLARVFIEKGASLEDRTYKHNDCPIHLAIKAEVNNLQLIKTLLQKGAHVNAVNSLNLTPLQLAIDSSNAGELVPLLLQYGADVSVKNEKGHNVLHRLALGRVEHVELAKLLIDNGVSPSEPDHENQYQPIHLAALHEKNGLIKLFVDRGADVNAPALNGIFPLWLAAELLYRTEPLKTLLRCGADIHLKRRSDGRTALHRACQLHNDDSIKLLLSAGADILAEDHKGKTPFANMMNSPESYFHAKARVMVIKELALKKVTSSVGLKDERIIKMYPELWDDFETCVAQINMMKSESWTLLPLLTKSHHQIALLIRNFDFVVEFSSANIQPFSMYAQDIHQAFQRARRHNRNMLKEENVINEAFYNRLPDLVVRKVINYIFNDIDCCEELIDVECRAIADFYMRSPPYSQ